jgi:L-alanine-DL-glutamate epimerase-like enolase superfamily enzyme
MKVTAIRTTGLRGATPRGGWAKEIDPDDVIHTLIAVHSDAGTVGIGSAFTSEALIRSALEVLSPLLLGETCLEPDRVTEMLHQTTFWLGRGGAMTHAISGINIALWDLYGKATGQPVGRLLGGRYREDVLAYASVLIEEPEVLSTHLEALADQGFKAFKIGWGGFGALDDSHVRRVVAAARSAIGDDAILAVDAGGSEAHFPGRLKWALRVANLLSEYGVAWFEEPLQPDAIDEFAELRRLSPIPISGGEVLTRRQAFLPFLKAGAFDIVQPDTTKGGGLSESRRIGWTASDYGVKLIPHGWNTAVGLAADLQLSSALPETDMVEYKTGSAYVDELTIGGWRLDDRGMIAIPSGPGLDATLDREALNRYATDPAFADITA